MFGQKLKTIRKYLSLTQDEMASILKIPTRTYTSYEREENNPPYNMLIELCTKHNVNLNWFVADIGDMLNKQQPSTSNDELEQKVVEVMKKYGVIEK